MIARRKIRLATAAAGAVLAALAAVQPVTAGTFSYTGSFQLAQGKYFFDQTTRGLYFFNGLAFNSEIFTLTATIPLIYQSTPYISYSGVGVLPSGGTSDELVNSRRRGETVYLPVAVQVQQFGIGDPLLHAGVRLWKEGPALPSLTLTANVKPPLASLESGFGTGAWDYGGGLSAAKNLGGVFLFADVAYWALGDLPELELQNPWTYSLAVGFPFSGGKAALLLSYMGMTEVIEATAPPSSLGLGLSFKAGPKSSLLVNGLLGLSESSPDFAVSFGWSLGF